MAVFHFSASIVSRRRRSVVDAAAYYASDCLRDGDGTVFDHGKRQSPTWSRLLAPVGAPPWAFDRAALWNHVEVSESRKDAQLARLVKVSLPCELTVDQHVPLVCDFVEPAFVALGMVADVNIRQDRIGNPFAVCLLTLRRVTTEGLARTKAREWNSRKLLVDWRNDWAAATNRHLERAGVRVRVDARSNAARGIALLPQVKVWVPRERRDPARLSRYYAERVRENQRRAAFNAELIRKDPQLALTALRESREAFRDADLRAFLRRWLADSEFFEATYTAVMSSPAIQRVGADESGAALYR